MMISYLIIFLLITIISMVLHYTIQESSSLHNSLTDVSYRAKSWRLLSDNRYTFDYRYINHNWRAYIRRTPDLGSYRDNYIFTNRIYDNNAYYICVTRPVTSLEEIKKISYEWADKMQSYINKEH